jgi:phage-related minor tail protein
MVDRMTEKDLQHRAVLAVASQYTYKKESIAYARELLKKEPQLWAYEIAQRELREDGFRVTQHRKDTIWRALGGKD